MGAFRDIIQKEKRKPKKRTERSDMPKGQKTCPNDGCSAVMGPATKVCPSCGKPASKPAKPESNTSPERELPAYASGEERKEITRFPDGLILPAAGTIDIIGVPAGEPPVRLKAEDGEFPTDDEIYDWAMQIRQEMLKNNQYLTNNGVKYWARRELESKFEPDSLQMKYLKLFVSTLPDVRKEWSNA
jgi:hypothetical protein